MGPIKIINSHSLRTSQPIIPTELIVSYSQSGTQTEASATIATFLAVQATVTISVSINLSLGLPKSSCQSFFASKGASLPQRKLSCFPTSSPGFESLLRRDFSLLTIA